MERLDADTHDNADAGINSFGYFSRSAKGWAHEDVYVGDSYTYNNRGIPDTDHHSGNGIVLSDVNDATIERCVSYNNGENNNYSGGGPIGKLRDGDLVRLCARRGLLETDADLASRDPVDPPPPPIGTGRELFAFMRATADNAEHGASAMLHAMDELA